MSLLQIGDLTAGDVLLFFDSSVAQETRARTGSDYSHAAIHLGCNLVAESCSSGVRKLNIESLLNTYERIAVFRGHNGVWTGSRINHLKQFIDDCIANGAVFNRRGVTRLTADEPDHVRIHNEISEYYAGARQLPPSIKSSYFCSELVAAAFNEVGIFDGAAQLYNSAEFQSPGALAREPAFGLYIGHIRLYEGYFVPSDDEFISANGIA